MRCERAKALGVPDCDVCALATSCEIAQAITGYATEKVVGRAKVSPNYQIALIKAVRPWVPTQPGQSVQYRKLNCGLMIIEEAIEHGDQ